MELLDGAYEVEFSDDEVKAYVELALEPDQLLVLHHRPQRAIRLGPFGLAPRASGSRPPFPPPWFPSLRQGICCFIVLYMGPYVV